MKIVVDRPPNFDDIVKVFPGASKPGVIFAYGDTVFCPSGQVFDPVLLAHEEVHSGQQSIDSPAIWWEEYLRDPAFRYHEELYAHAAEIRASATRNRNEWHRVLHRTAHRLIADLYQYPKPPEGPDFKRALADLQAVL
jgi:hypothetical protein